MDRDWYSRRGAEDWITSITNQHTKGEREPAYIATINATIVDRETGKKFKVNVRDLNLTDRYGFDFFEGIEEAERYLTTEAEDIVFEYIDEDSRFDSYDSFDNLECIIDDIDVEEDIYESIKYRKSKSFITEADNDLIAKATLFLDTRLSEFERGLPQTMYGKVQGYNVDWCADNYDNEYNKARDKFLEETRRILFANFNK